MELKIPKEILDDCFNKAMENIEIETGLNLHKCVEKQIPKRPYREGDGYADGHIVYDTWRCPSCNYEYEMDTDDHKFCPECGQRIDWSEDINDSDEEQEDVRS